MCLRAPISGRERVLTLLAGLSRRYAAVQARPVRLASGEGLVLHLDATVIGVIGIEVSGGQITELNLVVNPAKLLWVDPRPPVGGNRG